MSLFGRRVCSFFCTLPDTEVLALLGPSYLLAFGIRAALLPRVLTRPMLDQPRAQFRLDFALLLLPGVLALAYDSLVHAFPVGSGFKIMAGCATLGFFLGIDLSLDRERQILAHVQRRETHLRPSAGTRPLTARFALFGAVALILPFTNIFLLFQRDLELLAEASVFGAPAFDATRRVILREAVFVLLIHGALALNLVVSFARNLRLFFASETIALERVAGGDLSGTVPVFSGNEFGRIAALTNRMIEGLRDRALIREVLGKIVSPEIAPRLLARARAGHGLGGTRHTLVVLFADLRNFTSLTESLSPEALVNELNDHLGRMVACVHAHGGIVDKFVGDGVIAVFGLENPEGASVSATLAAVAMRDAAAPRAVAIGIHRGEAIAGVIGGADRHEFTFIGDVVNTAARLEALAKEEEVEILISAEVLDQIADPSLRACWTSIGGKAIRGKRNELVLYRYTKSAAQPGIVIPVPRV